MVLNFISSNDIKYRGISDPKVYQVKLQLGMFGRNITNLLKKAINMRYYPLVKYSLHLKMVEERFL